jgi:uncharacterized YccA/Bax inhibitor family protein
MAIFNSKNSSNPFLKESAMRKATFPMAGTEQKTMTIKGAIDKTLILFGIMMITSYISYTIPSNIFLFTGAIGGLIAVVVASFKQELSPFLAPIYALLEGLFLGTISAMFAATADGIVVHAVTLTISMLLLMLIIYRLQIIKVTEKFRAGVFMATGSIVLVYFMSWILGFFGVNLPFLHEGGIMGIGISLVIIGIAAVNLLLDFDTFEKGQEYGAPKYMEWYAGMGLLITLVWLYVEILRLLSKLNRD